MATAITNHPQITLKSHQNLQSLPILKIRCKTHTICQNSCTVRSIHEMLTKEKNLDDDNEVEKEWEESTEHIIFIYVTIEWNEYKLIERKFIYDNLCKAFSIIRHNTLHNFFYLHPIHNHFYIKFMIKYIFFLCDLCIWMR